MYSSNSTCNLQYIYYGLEEYDKAESCRVKAEQLYEEQSEIHHDNNKEKVKQLYI